MFAGKIKSALFIDYENANQFFPSDKITTWLGWLEYGEFGDGRRRRFIHKRAYINVGQQNHGHGELFTAHGFDVIVCEKISNLKNGLDIEIAVDITESLSRNSESMRRADVQEYIILAKDSDYVPVLKRLEVYNKRSIIIGEDHSSKVSKAFSEHADVVLPTHLIERAVAYPGRGTLWSRMCRSFARLADRLRYFGKSADTEPVSDQVTDFPTRSTVPAPRKRKYSHEATMEAAKRATIRVISLKPNRYTARAKVEEELLKKVVGFSVRGRNKYLKVGSFYGLMRELEKRDERIRVDSPAGGPPGIRYVPRDED
jgi:hypothetical protein